MHEMLVIVVLVALLVDFRWSLNISLRMTVLEVQDGAIVGVSPFSLASGPFEYINEHFWL